MRKANQITSEELETLVFLVNDGMPYDKVAKYFTINRGLKVSGTTVRKFYLNAIKQGNILSGGGNNE